MARTLAAAFTTEKNLLYARPFNSAAFHFGGAVGDIYVASFDVTIGGNAHKGIVSEWGEVQAVVEPKDGAFQVSRIRMALINHPIFPSSKRFTDLWSGIGVEGIEVDVYQNFKQVGTGTILQELLFAGVMRPAEYAPDFCALDLMSVSEKYLDKKELSFPIDQTDFPNADVDDIGKRANQIYGSVKKAVTHAVKAGLISILRADMTSSQTTIPIHDDYHDLLPTSGTVQVGDEKMTYTGKAGVAGSRELTGVTRAASGTTAEPHHKADTIIQLLTEFIYLAAGHEMKAINKVYVRRGDKIIPLTTAEYTVELANTALVAGKTLAILKFTSPPVLKQKEFVKENDGISVVDGGVNDTIGLSQANNEGQWDQAGSDETLSFPAGLPPGIWEDIAIAFPAQEKTKSSGNFKKQISWLYTDTAVNTEFYLVKGDATTLLIFQNATQKAPSTITVVESTYWGLKIRRKNVGGVNLGAVSMNISAKKNSYNISVAVSKTGTVAHSVTKSGTVSLSNTSTAETVIGDQVLFDGDGYKDDVSGTYTGTASALVEKPADVLHHLARIVGAIPAGRVDATSFSTARTDAPASYKFAGVLTERSSNLKELLLALGAQCRTRIDWPVDKLTARFLRSAYGAISKTLTEEHVMENGGRTTLRLWRTDPQDIVNKINLYYGRMWEEGRSVAAFKKVTKASDATSITKYGEREDAERFWFDFVNDDNATMADDLRDFWLARLKEPARMGSFDCKLDQYELLNGDIVALNFAPKVGGAERFDGLNGTQKLLVEEWRHRPGSGRDNRATRMALVLREVS